MILFSYNYERNRNYDCSLDEYGPKLLVFTKREILTHEIISKVVNIITKSSVLTKWCRHNESHIFILCSLKQSHLLGFISISYSWSFLTKFSLIFFLLVKDEECNFSLLLHFQVPIYELKHLIQLLSFLHLVLSLDYFSHHVDQRCINTSCVYMKNNESVKGRIDLYG